jgi:type IV secretion/conjugal transfer VirB4 family ATPase
MLGTPKHMSVAKRERAISTFIPYSCVIAPDTIKTREGDYLRTWKLVGAPFETVDPEELTQWKNQLNTLFRAIGTEKVSFYTHQVRRQMTDKLSGHFKNSFCRELDKKYYASFEEYRMLQNELYFTLIYRPHSGMEKRLSRAGRNLQDLKLQEEKVLRSLGELSSQVESGLKLYQPRKLTTYTIENVTFSEPLEFLNFLVSGFSQPVRLPKAPLYECLGTSQILVCAETIELRGLTESRFVRFLDFKEYPTATFSGILDGLLYAPFEYVLTQSFSCVSKLKGRDLLVRQQRQLSGSEDGSASQIEEMTVAIDGLLSGEFAVGEYHFSLAIFGNDIEHLRQETTQAQTLLMDEGFLPVLMSTALDAGFFAQLPCNWRYRHRVATLTTKNFASLTSFHNFAQGKRSGNPWGDAVTLLKTPADAPFYFNFHKATTNEDLFDQKVLASTLVLGQSGSGKTVWLTFMLCQLQKFGATSFFFDKDRGAELAIRVLRGKYLALETGQPSGLNPFQLEHTEENLQFLEMLVEVLVTTDGSKLSPGDKQRISKAIQTVMGFPMPMRRLGLLPQNMTEGGNREGSVVQRLARWCDGGPLAWVFDNETDSLDFTTHQTYGIDGTSFLDNAEVRTPISLYLLHRMEDVIDGRRFFFIMDEFWKWLGDSGFSDFVHDKLKTIRKQNGFCIFATQSPSDVLSSKIARAMVEQCATGIYFPNPRAEKEEYITGFHLTEAEFGLVSELSEDSRLFLVKQEKTSALAGLNLQGFDKELSILSGSTDNVALLHNIMAEVGEDPENWMPLFNERIAARRSSLRSSRPST